MSALTVHGVQVDAGVGDEGGGHGGPVVLEAEHNWSFSVWVLDVPVWVEPPVSTEQLETSLTVSSEERRLHSKLGDVSTSAVNHVEFQVRLRQDDLENVCKAILYCHGERIVSSITPGIPVNSSADTQAALLM